LSDNLIVYRFQPII